MKTFHLLTKQEAVVLAFVATGWRNREIASELFISPRTVETHLRRIFDKLGVSSRTQAALYAINNNFLTGAKIRGIVDDSASDRNYPTT